MGAFICTGRENSGPEGPGHSSLISGVVKAQLRVQPKSSVLRALAVQQHRVPMGHLESRRESSLA